MILNDMREMNSMLFGTGTSAAHNYIAPSTPH